MSGIGQGKVILAGEHAVVYGVPALAVGIDRGARAQRVNGSGPSSLSVSSWNIRVDVGSAGLGDLLATAFNALLGVTRTALGDPPDLEEVHVIAEADLPAGGGLGCSAAVGVAVARSLDPRARAAEIAERVGVWEQVFHGNASGVDAAVSAQGGGLVFRRGHPFEPVRLRSRVHLAIGNSGNPSSTKTMVEGVAKHRARHPEAAQRSFDAIGTLVGNARLALEAGDVSALGKLLDLNQMLLAGLFVSTPEIEQLCASAREAGALGAKLTGAGGGGCVVAIVPDEATGEHVLAAWRKDGFVGFTTSVGPAASERPRGVSVAP